MCKDEYQPVTVEITSSSNEDEARVDVVIFCFYGQRWFFDARVLNPMLAPTPTNHCKIDIKGTKNRRKIPTAIVLSRPIMDHLHHLYLVWLMNIIGSFPNSLN